MGAASGDAVLANKPVETAQRIVDALSSREVLGVPEEDVGAGNEKFGLGLQPIGRFGMPMEIAEAVVWMCSERASFMTGQSLVLDGGFLAGPSLPQ